MQKVLLVYEVSAKGHVIPANSVVEVENYPMSEAELRDYERQLKEAGGSDGVIITNVILLREEDE